MPIIIFTDMLCIKHTSYTKKM